MPRYSDKRQHEEELLTQQFSLTVLYEVIKIVQDWHKDRRMNEQKIGPRNRATRSKGETGAVEKGQSFPLSVSTPGGSYRQTKG